MAFGLKNTELMGKGPYWVSMDWLISRCFRTHSKTMRFAAALGRLAGTDASVTDILVMLPEAGAVLAVEEVLAGSDGWVYLIKLCDLFKIGRGDDLGGHCVA